MCASNTIPKLCLAELSHPLPLLLSSFSSDLFILRCSLSLSLCVCVCVRMRVCVCREQICAPGGSKARDAVNVEGSVGTCTPYSADSHRFDREAAFEIPRVMRMLARWDVEVTVRGWGAVHALGKPDDVQPVTWWCHKYRGPPSAARAGAAAAAAAVNRPANDKAPPGGPRIEPASSPLGKPLRFVAKAVRGAWARLVAKPRGGGGGAEAVAAEDGGASR